MKTPDGWKIQSKPRPGEDMKHFIRRLMLSDPLTIQDAQVMQLKRFAQWKVNEGNDTEEE